MSALSPSASCWPCSILAPQHSRRLQPRRSAIGPGLPFTTTWTNTCLGMMVRFVCTVTICFCFISGTVRFSLFESFKKWTGTAMQQLCRNATIGQFFKLPYMIMLPLMTIPWFMHLHGTDRKLRIFSRLVVVREWANVIRDAHQVFVLLSLATPPAMASGASGLWSDVCQTIVETPYTHFFVEYDSSALSDSMGLPECWKLTGKLRRSQLVMHCIASACVCQLKCYRIYNCI